ncbi:MAG: AAA family ATPase [Solirubrobacterales bacterium]
MTPGCASCGAELAADARFCSACGAPVQAEGSAPREARKVVSALFADVVGSTALGDRMDPEDFKDVIGEAITRMARAVDRFGGEVFEYSGDGLMALFGAPIAHEDDPERAILAGLEIVESVAAESGAIAERWAIEGLAVRVGIETGLAILGRVGGGNKLEYGAVGDALNTAARLQAAAESATVLVGPRTHRLTAERFAYGDPVELELKGKAGRIAAYRATRLRPLARRRPQVGAPLVGRDAELRLGTTAVEDVLAGSGRIVFVTGEAGVGKSRIISELRRRFEAAELTGAPARWLEGRCVSYGEALPYWPFRGLLREWVGELAREPAGEDLGAALRGELGRLVGERAAGLSESLDLVIAPAAGGAPAGNDPPPQVVQERIHAAVMELFEALATDGPVALALDDLHWADASSLALTERLLELADRAPVLIVLGSRPDRDHPVWPLRDFRLRDSGARSCELALEPLGGDRDRELLAALVGETSLPSELERRLLARAEGNPLYLEELVRSMVEVGSLEPSAGGWTFDRDVPVDLPETVEKLIAARIDRLSPGAQEVLGIAAVLGRQFPVALLDQVAGDDVPAAALDELQAAELLRDGPRWPVPFCAFRHTLIQETAYQGMLRRRRQELHAAAIEAIEALYPDRLDEFAGMVAHHADVAGDDRRALDYHRRAGDAAAAVYSVAEAIEHFDRALAAAARLGLEATDRTVREVTFARGDLHFQGGALEASRRDLEAALAAAREVGDAQLQVDAVTGLVGYWRGRDFDRASELMSETVAVSEGMPPLARVDSLSRLAIQYVQQLRFDRALEVGERALALASAEGDQRSAVRARDALKLVAQQLGDVERLEVLTDDLLRSLRDRPEDAWYVPWVMLEAGFVPLARGQWEAAQRLLDEALELTRRRGHRYQEPLFLDAIGWLHRARGDHDSAIDAGRKAAALAEEIGAGEWASWSRASLGWTLLEAGDPAGAAQCLERGLRTAEAANPPAQVVRCLALLAAARAILGDADRAAELSRSASGYLDRVRVPPGRAWLFGAHAYLALARVRIEAGDSATAEAIASPLLHAARQSGWGEQLTGVGLLGALSAIR